MESSFYQPLKKCLKKRKKKTSNTTANLTHAVLCVMLPRQHLESRSTKCHGSSPCDSRHQMTSKPLPFRGTRDRGAPGWVSGAGGRQESKPRASCTHHHPDRWHILGQSSRPLVTDWTFPDSTLCRYPRQPGTQAMLMNHPSGSCLDACFLNVHKGISSNSS